MHSYPQILSRLINEPLLAHPAKAEVVVAAVLRRQGIELQVAAGEEFLGPLHERRLVRSTGTTEPFLFDQGTGIAVISVVGSLAHRQGYIGASSGVMGYDGIGSQFQSAIDHPAVRGIILDMHTPGGEVHGAFQLADRIASARGRKPVIACVDEMAYSAGYLIASATDEIILASSTAGVGSIGAVVIHNSFERALDAEGITTSIFTFGARKADGNPFKDLSAEAADGIQKRIDYIGREFVTRVSTWRKLSERAVIDTQAGTFVGADAVKLRLADGIADPNEVFDAFAKQLS